MDAEDGFGCASCFRGEAKNISRGTLSEVAALVEESHFSVRVLACRSCGQRFVSIFCETIDWVDGDDPQYWSLLPVHAEEAQTLLSQGLNLELILAWGNNRRHLQVDHPKGVAKRASWRRHLDIAPHD
jgi:hypothetical protein